MAGQTDTHHGSIRNDFRKSNYKQVNPKPKLTGQQKPQAIFTSLASTQTQARFSVSQVMLYKKQKGGLATALLQSLASLALALQCHGQAGERDSATAIEPRYLLVPLP